MGILEAFILGIIQGLTEFLPVSSSGHLEIGKHFFNVQNANNITFTLIVHIATTLSIVIVFWNDLMKIIKDIFKFEMNESTRYVINILISMIPIGIIGFFFKDYVDMFFDGNIVFVGFMLIVTAGLLYFTTKFNDKGLDITNKKALTIGIVQAIAVLPGISRSGSTIAAALMLGVDRSKAARFSFLMVIIPILGAGVLEIPKLINNQEPNNISMVPMLVAFFTSFVIGIISCKLVMNIVKKGKLIYFSAYCLIIGFIAIISGLI